jgi:endonuclease/exonuclease/phosphatase family metal-dependent hydrolase
MRLMTWNILEGLLGETVNGNRHQAEERTRHAVDLVQSLQVDYFVINEALRCEPNHTKPFQNFQEIFGFPYSQSRLYDNEWGNSILSRYPIREDISLLIHPNGSSQNRGALGVKVETDTKPCWIATLHPHPRRHIFKRAADFDVLLEKLDGPRILAGDFNAISPEDQINEPQLVTAFEHFSQPGEAEASVRRFLEAGRILFDEVLPRYDMRDAMPIANRTYTIPTKLLSEDTSSAMRIDHVLVSKEILVADAQIIHDKRADISSDHYPIILDFTVTNS